MFVDEITIKLIAGKGGDGCTSFHHEKCMPNLGTDGANGGHGANIIFEVDKGLRTLVDLRYNKIVKGEKGENGCVFENRPRDGRTLIALFEKLGLCGGVKPV